VADTLGEEKAKRTFELKKGSKGKKAKDNSNHKPSVMPEGERKGGKETGRKSAQMLKEGRRLASVREGRQKKVDFSYI